VVLLQKKVEIEVREEPRGVEKNEIGLNTLISIKFGLERKLTFTHRILPLQGLRLERAVFSRRV
jgi:hypothetical protein